MISILVCAMLGQFKAGDSVYVKPPGATAWKHAHLAAARYRDQASYSGVRRPEDIPEQMTTWFAKRSKLSVMSVEDFDGEKIVRVKDENGRPWWMISTDVSALDDTAKAAIGREEVIDRLRPYCVTKPEHEALTIAAGKGLDPITMTASQAQALTPSQRRALSQVKARYAKASKKR